MYIAHRTNDENPERTQTVFEHLVGTAKLAFEFADSFGCGELGKSIALAHDIGKYSCAFQDRIHGKPIRVDHSTAGAQALYGKNKNALGLLAAYCAAGHHTGLPDGGIQSQPRNIPGSLYCRLSEQVPAYEIYEKEIELPVLHPPKIDLKSGFQAAFLTRMLYSCLVDADFLDTESFMQNAARKTICFDLENLREKLNAYVKPWQNPSGELNKKRTELLNACLEKAESEPGLFTLTAPTGSGKTVASIAFALNHAALHKKQRIIYVVPYNTIIEQNAAVYAGIFGDENVLQHHSGINYANDENAPDYIKLLATENWDAPLIVTSSVQFFESLFANRSSKCRKLHNIANSVLVFDEAQMIPPDYLIPCTAAIKELVTNYGCTAVLATATQASLETYFAPLTATEIADDPKNLYTAFKRVTYEILSDKLTLDMLAEQLKNHPRVLCVVNTRKTAQELAELTGALHLSTTMYPAHRTLALDEIRGKLEREEECRVISTSLIEAGVDVDFPAVYREKSGLDSIIQTGGRCNREGKRNAEDSAVTVFELDGRSYRGISLNVAAYEHVKNNYQDISSLNAVAAYFDQLHYLIGKDGLGKDVVENFDKGIKSCSFPFKTIAESFRLISDATETIYVLHERPDLEQGLRGGERSRALFRELQKYAVSLYAYDIQNIRTFERLDENVILFNGMYSSKFGVSLHEITGQAIIF
ncbi:MAG: CRISPR-associated helicase Cas3' [Gracilibacteraceae bacterium]|jgi:CRISPR-associated endonuclease/helicase Cas3|nr:CRISPR-associated helicase Cas3' [Gracilibacteraceae bacterium]